MSGRRAAGGPRFEDLRPGQILRHPVPRTIHGGDLALYIALTGDRTPLSSSTELAHSLGFAREVVQDLLVLHVALGKSAGQLPARAGSTMGYADVHLSRAVYPGDTLRATSEVIGSCAGAGEQRGTTWVTTRVFNQRDDEVARLTRWLRVDRSDPSDLSPAGSEPPIPAVVQPDDLFVPWEMNLDRFDDVMWATGGTALWDDYEVGQRIDHGGVATLADGEAALLARLVQSAAGLELDGQAAAGSGDRRRAVHDLHVVSVARAIAHDGLENVLRMAAWNRAVTRPALVGDTIRAWTEVLGRAELPGQARLGAVRLRLVAIKNADPAQQRVERALPDGSLDPRVVVELDWWGLVPRRRA